MIFFQDLFDYITERRALHEEVAKNFLRQIVVTIQSCHRQGVVHRDIKVIFIDRV